MRSRSTSLNNKLRPGIACITLVLAGPAFWSAASPVDAWAFEIIAEAPTESALYLEVFVNGSSRNLIAEVYQDADGSLSIDPVQLRNVGILPHDAGRPDGRVNLAALPDVTFEYDDLLQTLSFTANGGARAPLAIAGDKDVVKHASRREAPQADLGALLNYSLHGGLSHDAGGDTLSFGGLSGAFEGRLFGPFGLVQQTFSATSGPGTLRRLDSTWSYSDPEAMRTYRAGDVVTGALSWTRPTRLGGMQIQNSFGLRPDVVTFPVPAFSGSAALPSTVEVYLNNARRFSGEVPDGPFEISDLPVVSGAGTVQLVVRDELGQETVTESDYFVSQHLLKPGQVDYSAEFGFARTQYGTDQDKYDDRLMGSASLRYGLADWVTAEAHAEGGGELVNLGLGGVVALGHWGVGAIAAAGSSSDLGLGLQVTGSVQFELGELNIEARAQRTIGDYADIASVTFDDAGDPMLSAGAPPEAIYQLSLSLPVPVMDARMGLSYSQIDVDQRDPLRLVGATFSRPLLSGSVSASAFANLDGSNYGVRASIAMPIGNDISSGASVASGPRGVSVATDLAHPAGEDVGDVGWQVRYGAGDNASWSAAATTRSNLAEMGARVRHSGEHTHASAQASGSIVVAGGDLFAGNRISDAFAIVETGVPSVPVLLENRPAGQTGRNGKLLLPKLRAYQSNRVAIDPKDLPLDVVLASTRQTVTPADRSGVVVRFSGQASGGSALVILYDEAGAFLPVGSMGQGGSGTPPFMVGYDGQALIEGLGPDNQITLVLPEGNKCLAQFTYAAEGGAQVLVPDVVCHPI